LNHKHFCWESNDCLRAIEQWGLLWRANASLFACNRANFQFWFFWNILSI